LATTPARRCGIAPCGVPSVSGAAPKSRLDRRPHGGTLNCRRRKPGNLTNFLLRTRIYSL